MMNIMSKIRLGRRGSDNIQNVSIMNVPKRYPQLASFHIFAMLFLILHLLYIVGKGKD